MELWGQIISLVAMVAIILSFQCKSNRKLIAVTVAGGSLFAVSYFMLGQASAAVFNVIGVVATVMALKKELRNKFVFLAIVLASAVATYFTYNGWWSIVLMMAHLAGSYSFMFRSGKFIRNMRIFFVSPVWLINNIVFFSAGGIICEVITMISIIVSFIRYRKTGFEA